MKQLSALASALISLAISLPSTRAQQPSETYYQYLGNYPGDANPGWHEEAQGLAHDRDNWFITQKQVLWKALCHRCRCGERIGCR